MATFTDSLLEDLQAYVTSQADPSGNHTAYLSALAQMFEQVYGIVMDQGYGDDSDWVPGYGTLLDVQSCPTEWLPYLAMFVGAQIPLGASDAVARQVISQESNQQRGTLAAVVSATQRNLSGTQSVTLFERTAADGSTVDAYHFVLVVLVSEVVNATQLTNDVNAVKPGGVLWTLIQTSTWTIAEFEAAEATVSAAEAAFATVANLETDVT